MKNKKTLIIAIIAVLVFALAAGAYAAVNYGSEDDPLVTKSYLDKVLRPEIETELENELNMAISQLEEAGTDNFVVVNLAEGESISLSVGSEILLRSGSVSANGGFVDITAGSDAPKGTIMEANHLYMALGESDTLTAESEALLLIKGTISE